MTPNEKTIATFETRMRQMILRFQELKKENNDLYAQMETLRQQLDQKQKDYEALKMARMISITDGDLQSAKDRLAKLIREVNKCIGILSDENE